MFKSVFDSLFSAFVHFDGLNSTDMCVRSKGKVKEWERKRKERAREKKRIGREK